MIDKFTLRARQEGYRARSAYKLISLNRKYNLIKRNDNVLDLGAWPGAWIQICLNLGSKVTGVDVKQIKNIKDTRFILGDIFKKETRDKIYSLGKFDVVLSDLAPRTSGNIGQDQYKSLELSKIAFNIAREVLKRNGNFVCKTFQSQEFNEFLKDIRNYFNFVKATKPEASKKSSKEMYIVAKGYRT